MADRDARPLEPRDDPVAPAAGHGLQPIVHMPFRERLGDVAAFLRFPTHHIAHYRWSHLLVLAVLIVFAFDYAVDFLATALTEFLDETTGLMPEAVEYDSSLPEDIIGYLILAPLFEEAVYRGWLSGRIAALRFAVFGFAGEALFIASFYVDFELASYLSLGGLALWGFGLWRWLATRDFDTQVPEWFTRNFHWFVWGSSILFGLIHLSNYEEISNPLAVLIVLPQTIGGLFLAYTRTRLGLRAAMLHHALYNGVYLLMVYEVIPSPF